MRLTKWERKPLTLAYHLLPCVMIKLAISSQTWRWTFGNFKKLIPLYTWPKAPSPTVSIIFTLSYGISLIEIFFSSDLSCDVIKYVGFLFTKFILSNNWMSSLFRIMTSFLFFFLWQSCVFRAKTRISIVRRVTMKDTGIKIWRRVCVSSADSTILFWVWKNEK